MSDGLNISGCKYVQAVVGGVNYYCHRETTSGEFCLDHQPELPGKASVTSDTLAAYPLIHYYRGK